MHVIVCGKLILKIVYREQQDASPLILLPTHTHLPRLLSLHKGQARPSRSRPSLKG